jgi:hypothetical protein
VDHWAEFAQAKRPDAFPTVRRAAVDMADRAGRAGEGIAGPAAVVLPQVAALLFPRARFLRDLQPLGAVPAAPQPAAPAVPKSDVSDEWDASLDVRPPVAPPPARQQDEAERRVLELPQAHSLPAQAPQERREQPVARESPVARRVWRPQEVGQQVAARSSL